MFRWWTTLIHVALNVGGIAQVMSYHVPADIAEGRLVTALDQYALKSKPFYAVYPDGKLLPEKMRAILDGWMPKLRTVLSQMEA